MQTRTCSNQLSAIYIASYLSDYVIAEIYKERCLPSTLRQLSLAMHYPEIEYKGILLIS